MADGATVNWETLRELVSFRAENGCAISFYVNLDPQLTPTAADVDTRVRSLLDEAQKRVEAGRAQRTHDQQASVRVALERIERYFALEFSREGAHGVAVFAAPLDNYWRRMLLPEPVPDAVKVNNEFFLAPLVPLVGRADGVLVASVGRERGQLYELRDGRLEPVADRSEEQPRRHDQGGWSQANYQRHVDTLAQEHLREVADELERQLRRRGTARIVIACAGETRAELAGMLSPEVRAAVAGWTSADAHAGGPELLALAKRVLERRESELESAAVDRWHDEIGRDGRATAGWASTLEAATDGRVELLLYEPGVNHDAWRCPACGRLQVQDGKCPLDGIELEHREEGLDLVLHHTLARGGTARVVGRRRDLDPVGGIGALLRY